MGDPDSADHEKARALVEWARWLQWARPLRDHDLEIDREVEVYFWIDYACCNQLLPIVLVALLIETCNILHHCELVEKQAN